MPRALALETSGRSGSVAVVEAGRVLREEQFSHGLQHAAGIVPIIDRLCSEVGWAPRDLEEVYVSAGPGSFTGLRLEEPAYRAGREARPDLHRDLCQ
jgi:tRNA threonylcarbamoyladenosine biosynthesis protein TsaB